MSIDRRTVLMTPLLLTTGAAQAAQPQEPQEGQQAWTLSLPDGLPAVRCWLYMPPGSTKPGKTWPLAIFLHGSGERGENLDAVKVHGPPKHIANGRHYPFIVCSPQLEAGARWDPRRLHAMLQVLLKQLPADADRVYATGLSLGGHGVWDWAAAFPNDLAAIAPVCGFGNPAAACNARQVPARAYHGDADTVVPIAQQQATVNALKACGGTVEFIIYPGEGHGSWNPAYEDPALVPWLMAQKRR